MSFLDKIQKELNWEKFQSDVKKNIEEGLSIIKEGSTAVSQKIEKMTDDGKKKYRVFNLNMKVQEEFARLGGQIYDLVAKKSRNPLGNKKVVSILKAIKKLEDQIKRLEQKTATTKKRVVKKTTKKSVKKRTMQKKKASQA